LNSKTQITYAGYVNVVKGYVVLCQDASMKPNNSFRIGTSEARITIMLNSLWHLTTCLRRIQQYYISCYAHVNWNMDQEKYE